LTRMTSERAQAYGIGAAAALLLRKDGSRRTRRMMTEAELIAFAALAFDAGAAVALGARP
jgi:uncharacterized membrane protein YebE (DUF533 family)